MQPVYTIIDNESQYNEYCKALEELLDNEKNKFTEGELDLLTLLIEKWDDEHNTFEKSDPIELLHYLMTENNVKAKDLADILKVSKRLISDIIDYKKDLSKEIIRSLSERFKVSQEAFNKPYPLKASSNSRLKHAV